MKLNVSTHLPAVRVKVKEATCMPRLSILLAMPITLPYAEIMEINAQEEITWKRQNKQFIPKAIIQNVTDTKSEL